MLLRFETRVTQRRLGLKIEAKFRTLLPLQKLGDEWTKCPSAILAIIYMLNLTSEVVISGIHSASCEISCLNERTAVKYKALDSRT